MSSAEAQTHSVDSLSSLAGACEKLTIAHGRFEYQNLETALKTEGCEKPKVSVSETDDLAAAACLGGPCAVAVSAGNAVISDEGFRAFPTPPSSSAPQPLIAAGEQRRGSTRRAAE